MHDKLNQIESIHTPEKCTIETVYTKQVFSNVGLFIDAPTANKTSIQNHHETPCDTLPIKSHYT